MEEEGGGLRENTRRGGGLSKRHARWERTLGGGGEGEGLLYPQSVLLKRTLVAGELNVIVLMAGPFRLSLVGWRCPQKPSGLGGDSSSS